MNIMKQNKGFTLIELVVAVAVFSIVMTAGYGVLNFVNRTMNTQVEQSDTRKTARNIIGQITKDIQESTSVIDSNSFIEPSGDIIRYYYDNSNKRLVRELNGNKNIEYSNVIKPFSIVENQTNLFTVVLTVSGGKRVLETQQFNVARSTGTSINSTVPEDPNQPIALKFALITPGDIEITGSASIKGDIGTQSGKIIMSSATVDGKVYTGIEPLLDIKNSIITGGQPIVDASIKYNYAMPIISDAPGIQNKISGTTKFGWYPLMSPVTQDTYYEELQIDNYMEVDVSHKDIVIHTNSLKISGGSQKDGDKIVLKGDGKLTIYVDDTFKLNGVSYINRSGSTDKLTIVLKTSDFDLNGNCKLNGNVYAKVGSAYISGSSALIGDCVAGGNKVVISGGSVSMNGAILAPNATFSMTGSRVINGWVIAGGESKLQGGETLINYTPVVLEMP